MCVINLEFLTVKKSFNKNCWLLYFLFLRLFHYINFVITTLIHQYYIFAQNDYAEMFIIFFVQKDTEKFTNTDRVQNKRTFS